MCRPSPVACRFNFFFFRFSTLFLGFLLNAFTTTTTTTCTFSQSVRPFVSQPIIHQVESRLRLAFYI